MSEIDPVTKWLAVIGKWDFDPNGSATYVTPQLGQRPFGLCVSNYSLSMGEITFDFTQQQGEVDGRIVLGYKSPTEDYLAVGLGGYGHAYTLTHFSLLGGWRELVGVGQKENLVPGRKYQIKIKIEGQAILLEVDGVRAFEYTMSSPMPYGQVGLFAWGESGAIFSQVSLQRTSKDIEQVVVLVHGIRTFAEWQSMLKREFSLIGIPVAPTNYGYFDLLRFLLPVPWFRAEALNRLRILIEQIKADYPRAKISFLAHSFGTYLVSRFLQEQPNFQAHRVVFCGSVVKYNFLFEQIRSRFEAPIVNEASARDPWPLVAQNLSVGYGSVGTRGFNQSIVVVDRWHKGFGHSQYLEQSFCRKFWLPFFSEGIIVESEDVASKPSIWLSMLGFVANKYFLLAVVALLVALWPYIWIENLTPSANQTACADIRKSTSADWRAENIKVDQAGTFYVIVNSVTDFLDHPSLNWIVAHIRAYQLAHQFPTVSFDVMPTASVRGANKMQAIVLARGIPDKAKACEIRLQAMECGIARDAYVYQLGNRPLGCP
jgi:hypothetical protein